MTDFQTSEKNTTAWIGYSAIWFPLAVLMLIFGGFFVSDGAVLAKESAESTRISADINESYFADTEANDAVKLANKLEPRDDDEVYTPSETEDEDTDITDETDEDGEDADSETEDGSAENSGDVAGDRECSQAYISDNLRIDFDNDRQQVLKLQSFLKTFANYDYVTLSGEFDNDTLKAVKEFQTAHAEDVLEPWGYEADEATGYVYITTKQKINEIYCDEQFLLSQAQQVEIRDYRQKLNDWRSQGADFNTPQYLANYWGMSNAGNVAGANDTTDETTSDEDENQSDTDTNSGVTVTETPADDMQATSATDTEESEEGGFFDWLFGGSDDGESASSTDEDATSTDDSASTNTDAADEAADDNETDAANESDDENAATDSPQATDTATNSTSSIDGLAAGVFTGVNSVIDFIFSPTFLLIVLVILILLLIATLIETEQDDLSADESTESVDSSEATVVEESANDTDEEDAAEDQQKDMAQAEAEESTESESDTSDSQKKDAEESDADDAADGNAKEKKS